MTSATPHPAALPDALRRLAEDVHRAVTASESLKRFSSTMRALVEEARPLVDALRRLDLAGALRRAQARDDARRDRAARRETCRRFIDRLARAAGRLTATVGRLIARSAASTAGACAAGGATFAEAPPGSDDPDQRSALVRAEDALFAGIECHGAPVRFATVIDGRVERIDSVTMQSAHDVIAFAEAWRYHTHLGAGLVAKFRDGEKIALVEEPAPPGEAQPPASEAGGNEGPSGMTEAERLNFTISPTDPSTPMPDTKAAQATIDSLVRAGFPIRLTTYPTDGRGAALHALLPTAENLDLVLDANRKGASVGLLVHLVRADLPPNRAPKADDLTPRGLMLDIDGPRADGTPWTPAAILDALPMKPALIVETSPGRFHVLIGPLAGLTLESFRNAGKALAARFPGADPVTSPTKIVRMPGSLNLKHPEKPFLVRAVGGDAR